MDRDALRELFDYTTFTWASYERSIRALPDGALTQPVAGSGWPSLRDVLFHLAAAWDGWILGLTGNRVEEVDPAAITTWQQLADLRSTLRPLLRRVIDDVPDEEFNSARPDEEGGRAPRDIVAHILLHERGHHGDISTLLSALGTQPPMTDYLVYLFFRDRERGRGN